LSSNLNLINSFFWNPEPDLTNACVVKPRFRTIVPSFHSGLAVNMVARSATAAITTTSFSTTQIFALHLEYPPRRDLRGRRGLKSNGGGLWPRKIPITTNTFWRLFRSTCPVRIWAELGRRALHFRYRPSFTALRLPQHSHILCNRGGFSNKLGDILPFLECCQEQGQAESGLSDCLCAGCYVQLLYLNPPCRCDSLLPAL
jgi:hypothetical protein